MKNKQTEIYKKQQWLLWVKTLLWLLPIVITILATWSFFDAKASSGFQFKRSIAVFIASTLCLLPSIGIVILAGYVINWRITKLSMHRISTAKISKQTRDRFDDIYKILEKYRNARRRACLLSLAIYVPVLIMMLLGGDWLYIVLSLSPIAWKISPIVTLSCAVYLIYLARRQDGDLEREIARTPALRRYSLDQFGFMVSSGYVLIGILLCYSLYGLYAFYLLGK